MKEAARRAMRSIARNRKEFESTEKQTDKPGKKDFFTTADTEAQKIYLRKLQECFPTYGVVAEEDELSIPCTEMGTTIYFTVDPLDGTSAFRRRQSQGIGTMISLVWNGEVVGACVGDVMTKEIYYSRPGSTNVHRFSWDDEYREQLKIDSLKPLSEQYVLLGDDPRLMSLGVGILTDPRSKDPIFKSMEVSGGSIGVKFARLWKSEVGAIVLGAGKCTPWDWCPLVGISKRLGFVLFEWSEGTWVPKPMVAVEKTEHWQNDTIVIHESRIMEFLSKAN
jgi:fructose-1,6-bisphosphatase/inositol monophosphatase family enzyme